MEKKMGWYERVLRLLNSRNSNRLTLDYGLSQGHINRIKKGQVGKAAGFWMLLALDCLEVLPAGKRKKILKKREKKT
jgi:hypothetical protein